MISALDAFKEPDVVATVVTVAGNLNSEASCIRKNDIIKGHAQEHPQRKHNSFASR